MSKTSQPCSDLELLAAFVDGRLSGEERAQMTAHLAACEDCYETFAETVRIREELGEAEAEAPVPEAVPDRPERPETGKILTFPRWRRYLPAAAPAAAAAVLALLVWSPWRLDFSVESLTAGLGDPSSKLGKDWTEHRWPAFRGGPYENLSEQQLALRIGVRVVELEVALAADDLTTATSLANELPYLWKATEFGEFNSLNYEAIHKRLLEGETAGVLDKSRRAADDADDFVGDSAPYLLGKWAAAGRLAAAAGNRDYFRRREVRALPRRLDLAELPEGVVQGVREAEQLMQGDLGERDFEKLRAAFDQIIDLAG